MSIPYMKGFHFITPIVENYSTVRENAVNIEYQEFDVPGNRQEFFMRKLLHSYQKSISKKVRKVMGGTTQRKGGPSAGPWNGGERFSYWFKVLINSSVVL